jgi:hypothetical protein
MEGAHAPLADRAIGRDLRDLHMIEVYCVGANLANASYCSKEALAVIVLMISKR